MYTTSFTVKTINAFSFVSITHNIFNSELESVGNQFIHIVFICYLTRSQSNTKKKVLMYNLGLTTPESKKEKN